MIDEYASGFVLHEENPTLVVAGDNRVDFHGETGLRLFRGKCKYPGHIGQGARVHCDRSCRSSGSSARRCGA